MANYNLTSQQIKDTYEQLVQVSGSALVDGTGSLVDNLDYVTNPTFTAYTSSTATSTSASVADLQTQINSLEAGSGSADWSLITNKPTGLVSSSAQTIANLPSGTISGSSQVSYTGISDVPSGILSSSAQIAGDISGSFTSTSASLASDIATNKTDIATKLDTSVYTSNSSSVSTRLTTNEGNISTQTSRVDSLVSATSSYAVKNSNNTFTGTQTFDNIAVNGTGSFAYIQSVTGSAKIIGDAYIILNNNTPAERYAGVKVYDSGSTNNSASFEFDGQTNDWFYEYTDDGGATEEFGVVMFGPGYNTRGSHVYPSNNTILKGTGDHHIVDSIITDDGSTVTVGGDIEGNVVTANTYFAGDLIGTASLADTASYVAGTDVVGAVTLATSADFATLAATATTATSASFAITASYALNAAGGGGLVAGTGTDSMRSSDDLTTTAASATGNYSIALGEGASTSDPSVIAIGTRATATAENGLAIGIDASSTGFSGVSLGELTSTTGDDTIAIGTRAEATNNNAIAMGRSAQASGQKAIAIGFDSRGGGNFSVALGDEANAGGSNSFAQAAAASAAGNHSIAFGELASAGQDHSIVMGQGAASTATNGIAIGSGSSVSTAGAVNIGDVFVFDGVSNITLSGSSFTLANSGSQSGSLIDNFHPEIASSSAQIQHIVTIDQTAYTTLSGSGNVYDDTLYIISDAVGTGVYDGSLNITGNLEVDGNLQVDGQLYSPMFAGTIASSTSSIDFDNGNFATLNCASSTFLANPTNLQGGTTYTLVITNGANISGYGTAWKFAGGTEPTLSANTDVITAVSDGTSLYAAALADFS